MTKNLLAEYLKARGLNLFDKFTISDIEVKGGAVHFVEHNAKCRAKQTGQVELWSVMAYMFETILEK